MKRFLRLSATVALSAIPAASYAAGFSYPFEKISSPSCKWNAWSTLGDDCKIDFPKIAGARYSDYEKNSLYRRVYSVLWGSTYDYGWDLGNGSHLGVDIATSAGTPVLSIGDGEVVSAGWANGWGNTVAVKHALGDSSVIYSTYSHLSKIDVAKGSKISRAQKIGEVGNTGNSYGNHLHFQIDTTNQAHPYYYVTCGKGRDPLSIVNQGLCRDYLTANTIDPIAFLESGQTTAPGGPTAATVENIQNRPQQKVDRTNMKSRAEIQEEEMQEFLRTHSVSIGLSNDGTNLRPGASVRAFVTSKDVFGRPTTGNFPELGIEAVFDRSGLSVFPERIVALDGGKREFAIRALKPGSYEITFKMGSATVATRKIFVLSDTDARLPATAKIALPSSILLGDDRQFLVVMQTKYGTPLLDSPFDGRYELSALNGKVKFCNASKGTKNACRTENLVDRLEFSYADTYRGVLVAKVRAYSFAPVALELVRKDLPKAKSVTRTKKDAVIGNPRGFDNSHPYAPEILSALQKGWYPLKDGYLLQDRELVGANLKELVRRYLGYRYLKAGNDFATKKAMAERIVLFEKEFATMDDYRRISRGELANALLRASGTAIVPASGRGFTDETGAWKDSISTIRETFAFKWKDQFGQNYFQPDKIATVGEALYVAEKIGY